VNDSGELLAEQIAYYRACASEYDQWWLHLGNRRLDTTFGRQWTQELQQLTDAVDDFAPTGRVLEIAGGTGNFTMRLAQHANSLTVLDASPEALDVSRRKLHGAQCHIDYIVSDIFDWEPSESYDVVFFSFWLSHVPRHAFAVFWATVRQALAPAGRVLFLDNLVPLTVAADQIRRETGTAQEFGVPHTADLIEKGVSVRELSDGRRFRVVKRFWTAGELAEQVQTFGWVTQVHTTGRAFLWGTATPRVT
jgi:demethylmenaquinone methyltransferase/2-methoxy-6-polyprenyl-1,4-benzoquinol methylase